eukprot:739913_1
MDGAYVYESNEYKNVIAFRWNKKLKSKEECDTQHMLYLLQLVLHDVCTESTNRKDLFITRLDAPRIITNLLHWHNEDRHNNKFDGNLVYNSNESYVIEDVIAKIGDIPLGPAIKIWRGLEEIDINSKSWQWKLENLLQLSTRGYDRMYLDDKILSECSVDELVACTLLTFVNENMEHKEDGDGHVEVQGIFAIVEHANNQKIKKGKRSGKLFNEPDWKNKIVHFFRDQNINGKTFLEVQRIELAQRILNHISAITKDTKPRNAMRCGILQIVTKLKQCSVQPILDFL